ncbi:MAG: GDP-mannose 4,6-dehydratase [Acidobacteriota bacterium]|jgi:GDPmannose 4,6-dehydratase
MDQGSGAGKTALITGITGQDGSYLAELLLEKGYTVHGILRRSSSFNTDRIDHIFQDPHEEGKRLLLHFGDLAQGGGISDLIREIRPDEVYNLAAQSHVRVSFDIPEYTADVVGLGTLRLLDAIRKHSRATRFYQASSSEMFGRNGEAPQGEATRFYPASPYGCAKVFGYWVTRNYREAYDLFAVNGILFNHESPRRGGTFVTRKTTRAVARIQAGQQERLYLGNLEARRDWGYAPDYVEAMWRMLQHATAEDYVVATGETHTVRELVEEAFRCTGVEIRWEGSGLDEKGLDAASGAVRVEIDPRYFRPTEVDLLQGDATRARELLGWSPRVCFRELVRIMVDADVRAIRERTDYKFR